MNLFLIFFKVAFCLPVKMKKCFCDAEKMKPFFGLYVVLILLSVKMGNSRKAFKIEKCCQFNQILDFDFNCDNETFSKVNFDATYVRK